MGSEEKDERSLMARLAVHTSDKEKLLRIFKASGNTATKSLTPITVKWQMKNYALCRG